MAKSPDAFRTISEVADWLGIQAHVLRFWESKFAQVKPIKRAGGRRYYRPGDMLLLGGIKKLLHDDGLTIKGVQKILREEGMSHVADMSAPLDELTLSQLGDAEPVLPDAKPATAVAPPEEEKGVVLNFQGASKPAPEAAEQAIEKTAGEQEGVVEPTPAEVKAETIVPEADMPEPVTQTPVELTPEAVEPAPEPEAPKDAVVHDTPAKDAPPPQTEQAQEPNPEPSEPEGVAQEAPQDAQPIAPPADDAEETDTVAALPAFLRRPLADMDTPAIKPEETPQAEAEPTPPAAPEPTPPPAMKPRIIDLPAFTAEADFPAAPATLTAAFRARKVAPAHAAETKALLTRFTALRDQMAARRRPSPPAAGQD